MHHRTPGSKGQQGDPHMKTKLTAFLLAALLLLSLGSCGAPAAGSSEEDGVLTIAATTYPIYEFATYVAGGMDGIEIELVVDQQISCLHDYTLTVDDMRTLERADVILINGAGLEAFMEDALATVDVPIIDCSEGIELLPYAGHEDHDHSGGEDESDHYDPHIWMDPNRAIVMMENIARGLAAVDDTYTESDYMSHLMMPSANISKMASNWQARFDALPEEQKYLITFHDGFAYLADAFDLTLLKSIEEEAGSEASAKDITEIVGMVREYGLPVIFVEENGSDATAKAIQRETGVEIGTLSMIMSDGPSYLDAMEQNLQTIYSGLTGEELSADAQ